MTMHREKTETGTYQYGTAVDLPGNTAKGPMLWYTDEEAADTTGGVEARTTTQDQSRDILDGAIGMIEHARDVSGMHAPLSVAVMDLTGSWIIFREHGAPALTPRVALSAAASVLLLTSDDRVANVSNGGGVAYRAVSSDKLSRLGVGAATGMPGGYPLYRYDTEAVDAAVKSGKRPENVRLFASIAVSMKFDELDSIMCWQILPDAHRAPRTMRGSSISRQRFDEGYVRSAARRSMDSQSAVIENADTPWYSVGCGCGDGSGTGDVRASVINAPHAHAERPLPGEAVVRRGAQTDGLVLT